MNNIGWSSPAPYNLERTSKRASVPLRLASEVPEAPGIYAVIDLTQNEFSNVILNLGHAGPRANSKPHGLRGRLATTCAHSSSEAIATYLNEAKSKEAYSIIWLCFKTKNEASLTEGALLELFRREFGRLPKYNSQSEFYENLPLYTQHFIDLKEHIRTLKETIYEKPQ